jgi:hypothetical protein
MTRRCIPISDWDVEQNPMEGKLVLDPEQTIWDWNHNPQVLDLADGSLESFSTDWFPFKENISPDREKFFWIDENKGQEYDTLTLRSLDGTMLVERKWTKSWGIVAEWFDNNRLIIFPPRSEQYAYGTGILFNPFNGKTTVLAPKFQDELNIDRLVISYQPAFHFALFYGGSDFVLYDLIENKDVIRNGFGVISPKPVWNKKGEKVYFLSWPISPDPHRSSDLFTYTTEGIRNNITSLGSSFKVEETWIANFQLSPDETKIALEYGLIDNPYPELAILDLVTQKMVDTCLINPMGEAYWSPDGSKLAITIPVSLDNLSAWRNTRNEKLEMNIIILDLKSWTGFRISVDNAVVGWITK